MSSFFQKTKSEPGEMKLKYFLSIVFDEQHFHVCVCVIACAE